MSLVLPSTGRGGVATGESPRPVTPGAGLLHPGAALAVLTLALNDHWGKAAFPGLLTGKLSDLAGLAFFPLLLQAFVELRGAPPSRRGLGLLCVLTALGFSAVKTWPPAHLLYEHGLGWLQWPARALLFGATAPVPVRLEADPTDLWTLPAVALAWAWGRARCRG